MRAVVLGRPFQEVPDGGVEFGERPDTFLPGSIVGVMAPVRTFGTEIAPGVVPVFLPEDLGARPPQHFRGDFGRQHEMEHRHQRAKPKRGVLGLG
jgi:hypothetical protein